jgi:hypothetical protein
VCRQCADLTVDRGLKPNKTAFIGSQADTASGRSKEGRPIQDEFRRRACLDGAGKQLPAIILEVPQLDGCLAHFPFVSSVD